MPSRIHQNPPARDDELPEIPEPANLRFLRRMVTLLTVTMIVGIMVVAGALVVRIAGEGGTASFTEVRIDPRYSVLQISHVDANLYSVVLEDREDGSHLVRTYRTDGPVEQFVTAD